MRTTIKNTPAFLMLYVLVIAGMALFIETELDALVHQLMNETARLVGTEMAGALHEPSVEYLLGNERSRKQDLSQLIAGAKARSDTLVSIQVVDARGRVIAADDQRQVAAIRRRPNAIFKSDLKPMLLDSSQHRFDDGKRVLVTPLVRRDRLLGYISIGLSNRGMISLHRHGYSSFLMAALAGFVALVALGGLLQLQLRRLGASLTTLMEAVAKGESEILTGRDDKFLEMCHAARHPGNQLKAARGQASLAETRPNAVANIFEVGVILIGPQGAPEYMNESAKRIFIGDRPEDFDTRFAKLRAELDGAIGQRCRPRGVAGTTHIEMTDATGVSRRLRVELHALDLGDTQGCLLIIKDCDLLDAMDENLRAATRARSLSRLYAAAAHDLKAPLNAMSLQLELLRRGLDTTEAEVSRRLRHHVHVLTQEMQHLNRLLSSLLEQGAPTAEGRAVVNLTSLINELLTLLTPQARSQRVTLDVEPAEHAICVFGNPAQLKQALLNVTLNALECVPDGGHVDIHLSTDSATASVVISDDGPGIPVALLNSIFDMHFTTKKTGAGIGLYVARAVAESHGGEIRVDSQLGAGSTFTISLPLHRANRRTQA
ncbi:MAG: HAMP domain-containing histidine kinase [Pseudomonadota bacterium]|nr:HAMP domain-containing histidine kinase [Pseudomonadota bacterium]